MPYIGQRPSKGDENNFKILDNISSYTLTFDGSDSSVVSAANDTITSLSHRFVQGQRVTYNKGGGTVITGLSDGVYYIIKNDHNTIKLATSASNAANGTAVNITGVGGGSSHTLNVAFDGVNTKFKATHTNGQKAKITRSAQLVISINGVIQQPHDTATPSTGFGFDLDGTIVFSQAPVSTDEYWAHVLTNNNVTFDISDNDVDNFTGNGSTVSFNLTKSPPDNRNVLVTIDGVVQYPNDPDGTVRAYNVVENVLTFTTAPVAGAEIQVRHIGFAGSSSGSGGGGVTNFYGRTGSVVLKNTDNIVANNAEFAGNLTVNGTMTTLDTKLTEVDQLEVAANNTTVGVAITQSGSGDILNLYDGSTEVFSVADGGAVSVLSTGDNKGLRVHTNSGVSATDNVLRFNTGQINGFTFNTNSDGTSSNERLRITSNGAIQLSGGANGHLQIDNNGEFEIFESNTSLAMNNSSKIAMDFASNVARIRSSTNGSASIRPLGFFMGAVEKVRITPDGKVGIGTDAPLAGLHISDGTAYGSPQISSRKAQLIISAGTETSADIQLLAGLYQHIFFGTSSDSDMGSIVYTHTGGYTNTMNVKMGTGNMLLRHQGTVDIKSSQAAGNSFTQSYLVRASDNAAQYQIGMYSNASEFLYINNHKSNIVFTHASNDHVTFASDGKVGIGTALTAPSFKLDLREAHGVAYAANATSAQLGIGNINSSAATNSSGIHMYSDGNGRGVVNLNCLNNSTSASADFAIQTRHSGTLGERLRIKSDGKVGIGINNPLSGTHISDGTAYGSPQNPSRKATLTISAGSEGSSDIQLLSANYNHIFFGDSADPNTGIIWYEHTGGGTDSMNFATAGTHKLKIDSDGRLLVGLTSDPAESSIVAEGNSNDGTSYAVLDLRRGSAATSSGNVCGYIRFSDTNINSSNVNYAWIAGMADGTSSGGNDNPGRLVFATCPDNGTAVTERLRIDSNGNLWLKSSSNNQQPKLRIESYGEYGEIKADGNGSIVIDADPDFNANNTYIGFKVDGTEKARIDTYGTTQVNSIRQRAFAPNTGSTNQYYWKIGSVTLNGSEGFILTFCGTGGYSNGQQIAGTTKVVARCSNASTLVGYVTGESHGAHVSIEDVRWKHEGSNVFSIWAKVQHYSQISPFVDFFGGALGGWIPENTSTGSTSAPSGSTAFSEYAYKQIAGVNTIQYLSTQTYFLENIRMADGKGIDFSATSDASGMTSELLDDYEEGTWTPAIAFDVGGGSITYGTRSGTYVKIGRMVHLQYYMNVTGGVSSSDYFARLALPFTGIGVGHQDARIRQYNNTISDWFVSLGGSNPVFYESNGLGNGSTWARGDNVNGVVLSGQYTLYI